MKTEFILSLTLSLSLSGGEDPERARARKCIILFEQRFSFSTHAHKDALSIRVTARTRRAERE